MKQLSFERSLFIDTSKIEEIRKWNATGIIDGVTTNQLILLKDGVSPAQTESLIKEICVEMVGKPVSVELTDSTVPEKKMISEAHKWSKIADNIVIKVPLIPDTVKSLQVIKRLTGEGIAVNVTVLMTFEQMFTAVLAARDAVKPSFASIFYCRSIEDQERYRCKEKFSGVHNQTPEKIIEETAKFLKEGNYSNPKILVGSIRYASMVGAAFAAGANIVTVTPDVLNALLFSRRTIETIADFDQAWKDLQKRK